MLDHPGKNRKRLPFFFLLTSALAITSCSDIDGDPLAFLAPGPPGQERPDVPDTAELKGMTPGAATVAMAPTDPFLGLQGFQPRPGGMKGTLGLNLQTYMDQNTGTPEERIERLERVIVAMHRDMQAMGGSLQAEPMETMRLVSMEPVMGGGPATPQPVPVPLTAQPTEPAAAAAAPTPLSPPQDPEDLPADTGQPELEVLVSAPLAQQEPGPAAAAAPPAPAPPAQGTTVTTPAASSGATATALRGGQHAGYVRLVIDVTGDTPFTADLDNTENILLIELPAASWSGPGEQALQLPLVKSYKAEKLGETGSIVVVQLDAPTSILSQSTLPGTGAGRRIVLDLKR